MCLIEFCTAPELLHHQVRCEKPIDIDATLMDSKKTAVDFVAECHAECSENNDDVNAKPESNDYFDRSDTDTDQQHEPFDSDSHQEKPRIRTKRNTGQVVCDYCNRSFSNKSNLIAHHRNIHFTNGKRQHRFTCDVCKKGFAMKSEMVVHRSMHDAVKRYACDQCSSSFSFQTNLRRHKLSIHSDCEKILKCDECDMRFLYKSELTAHQKKHTNDPYSCKFCGRAFWTKSNLLSHERIAHEDVECRRFECTKCGKRFAFKSHLVAHSRGSKHRKGEKRQFECWICHKA